MECRREIGWGEEGGSIIMGEVVICVLVEHHSHENFNTSCWFLTTRATTRFCGFCGFCGLRAVMARIPGYFFSRPPPLRFRRRLDLRSPDHPVSSHPLSCYARSSAPSLSYACLVCLLVCPRFSHPTPPRRRAVRDFPQVSGDFPRFSPYVFPDLTLRFKTGSSG